MRAYEEIKAELFEIAEVLKKYPENIQPQVFEILTRSYLGEVIPAYYGNGKVEEHPKPPKMDVINKPVKTRPIGKSGVKAKETLSLLKDLDLRPKGQKSFKDFYEEKTPNSAGDFNTVAVYYLSDIVELPGISPNHIYTCYKEVGKRPPEAFIQSLRDTASKNAFIDTSDMSNIKIALRGRNFVDHDLPKQKTKKQS